MSYMVVTGTTDFLKINSPDYSLTCGNLFVFYCRHNQSFSMILKCAFNEKWSDEKYSLGNPLYAAIVDSGIVSNTAVTFKFSESNQM